MAEILYAILLISGVRLVVQPRTFSHQASQVCGCVFRVSSVHKCFFNTILIIVIIIVKFKKKKRRRSSSTEELKLITLVSSHQQFVSLVSSGSLAVVVVENVDAVDQLKPKVLVASVVFSMAEYIFLFCSLWNLLTGLVIKPVIRILKIVAFVVVVLSIVSSGAFRDIAHTVGITSSLPDHYSYDSMHHNSKMFQYVI